MFFMNAKEDRYVKMTTTPVPKLITQLAVPTIISMLVTGIYNTADTFFVSKIPENPTQATAAVGIVFPMMAIIQAIGFFYGHGSGNYLSRMLGAGEKEKASDMASTGFVMAVLTETLWRRAVYLLASGLGMMAMIIGDSDSAMLVRRRVSTSSGAAREILSTRAARKSASWMSDGNTA